MEIDYAHLLLIDREDVRGVMVKHILNQLNDIDPMEILEEFEFDDKIENITNKLDGDVFTNKKIADFESDAVKLINITLRNLKRQVKQMVPLYIVTKRKK